MESCGSQCWNRPDGVSVMKAAKRAISETLQIMTIFSSLTLLCFVPATLGITTISSLSKDLNYDENNHLVNHALVSVGCENEPVIVTPPSEDGILNGFDVFNLEGEAKEQVFPDHAGSCQAACIEQGTDRLLAQHIMPHKYWDTSERFTKWFDICRKVELCFINYHDKERPIHYYWVDFTGSLKRQQDIKYGERETRCFWSFVGHKFMVHDADDNFLEEFNVRFHSAKAFGTSPPSDQRRENHQFEGEIHGTLRNEWKRHQRVTRTFSSLGFKKGRLPPDVFASMGAFYYNNRNYVVREEWRGRGVFVNWWETDVKFVQIPWNLKRLWQQRLLTLVEAWAGVPVEQTVMYGLRQYTSGARLLSHVDRHETHAVSLIVNIAQGNLTEPWPVEVQDHSDRLHEVVMEPGDIVYYESAKCLHARNRPMMGNDAYYVNLFTHYKPITDETWWNQPNHEGTPEPLLEVEGECKLVNGGVSKFGEHGGLGMKSVVQCDDERLGPHVSPTFFQAKTPDDMIQWWTDTSPQKTTQNEESSHDEL